MTTPEQFLDQLTAAERSATGPPVDVRERVWGDLRAQLDAGASAPLLDDAPLLEPAGSRGVALKIVGALVLVGVIGGGLALALRDRTSTPTPVEQTVTAAPSALAEPMPEPRPEPIVAAQPPALVDEPAPAEPAALAPTPAEAIDDEPAPKPKPTIKSATKPEPKPEPKPGKTLADELVLMQALSTALKQGDSQRAQKLVAEHERDFAKGQFVEERHAAKARALCMAGKLDSGRKLARSFEKRWPSSIHLTVVRTDCDLGHD